jgi:hypothetical protein
MAKLIITQNYLLTKCPLQLHSMVHFLPGKETGDITKKNRHLIPRKIKNETLIILNHQY